MGSRDIDYSPSGDAPGERREDMNCKECCYCWKDEGEKYPSCKWVQKAPGELPPCEEEEYSQDDEW